MLVEGKDLAQMSRTEVSDMRRDRLGFIFQAYNLIPVLTAAENAEFVLQLQGKDAAERRQRAMETLAAVGLKGMENRRPNELSGGQQQRVAVARAIAADPALVLADEPTGNLDSETGRVVMSFFHQLHKEQGATLLMVTHDPNVAALADRRLHMKDGRLISIDKPTQDQDI